MNYDILYINNKLMIHINYWIAALFWNLFSVESLKRLRVFLQVYFYHQSVNLINNK